MNQTRYKTDTGLLSYDEAIAFINENAAGYDIEFQKILPRRGRTKLILEPIEKWLGDARPNLFAYGILSTFPLTKTTQHMDDLFFKYASMQTLPITFTRYLKLSRDIERISITRALQYEIIRSHPFNGLLLDVGGGRNADYLSMINCEVYEAINIDAAMEPTWKVGVGERFPCSSEQYDTVISFNTLEHVFDPRFIINEMTRVIKKGGKLAITTPFCFQSMGILMIIFVQHRVGITKRSKN